MANNFQKTGTNYIDKSGTTPGTGTKDDPKKGANQILTTAATNVIGTGTYLEVIGSITTGGVVNRFLVADGKVTLLGNGSNVFANIAVSQGYLFLEDLEISSFANIVQHAGISFAGSGDGTGLRRCIIRDCTALNMRILRASATDLDTILADCVVLNSNGTLRRNNHTNSGTTFVANRCLFLNSNINLRQNISDTVGAIIANSYIAPDCTIDFKDKWPNNCNYRGKIILADVLYNSIDEAHTARPELGLMTTLGNINQEPQFNNEFAEMFTLKTTSPHLAKGIGPSWLRLAAGFLIKGPVGDVASDSGHYVENISSGEQFPIYFAENLTASLQGGQVRFKVKEAIGGPLTGRFRVMRRVSEVPVALGRNDLAIGLNFNTDFPAAEGQFEPNNPNILNNNVPNARNYTSGDAGRRPNRLDFLRRWSTKDAPSRFTPTDWITGATDLIFQAFADVTYNPVTLKGNADLAYQVAPTDTNDTPASVIATWVDDEIVLSNNTYSK